MKKFSILLALVAFMAGGFLVSCQKKAPPPPPPKCHPCHPCHPDNQPKPDKPKGPCKRY